MKNLEKIFENILREDIEVTDWESAANNLMETYAASVMGKAQDDIDSFKQLFANGIGQWDRIQRCVRQHIEDIEGADVHGVKTALSRFHDFVN